MDTQAARGDCGAPLKLIELYALPGAGKSSVVGAFVQRSPVTTRKDMSRAWRKLPRFRRFAYIARAAAYRGQWSVATRFAIAARLVTVESQFRLLRLVAKSAWIRSRSGTVLLDQGFLQDIWSILLSNRSSRVRPALVSPLLHALYDGMDTTIVLLEVDCATAAARVAGRTGGDSRFDSLPHPRLRQSIERANALYRDIAEAARLAGLRLLVLDGRDSIGVVAERLHALFPQRPTGAPTQPAMPIAR